MDSIYEMPGIFLEGASLEKLYSSIDRAQQPTFRNNNHCNLSHSISEEKDHLDIIVMYKRPLDFGTEWILLSID